MSLPSFTWLTSLPNHIPFTCYLFSLPSYSFHLTCLPSLHSPHLTDLHSPHPLTTSPPFLPSSPVLIYLPSHSLTSPIPSSTYPLLFTHLPHPTLLTSPLFHIHTPPLTHLPFSLFISPSHPPFLSLTSSHPLSPLAYLPFPTCYRTLTLSTRLLTLSVPTSPESHPAPHPIPLQSTPLASPIIPHLLTPTHSLNLPLHTPLSYQTCLVCIPTHSHLFCTNNLFCTNDIKKTNVQVNAY